MFERQFVKVMESVLSGNISDVVDDNDKFDEDSVEVPARRHPACILALHITMINYHTYCFVNTQA